MKHLLNKLLSVFVILVLLLDVAFAIYASISFVQLNGGSIIVNDVLDPFTIAVIAINGLCLVFLILKGFLKNFLLLNNKR